MLTTRRVFCSLTAIMILSRRLPSQSAQPNSKSTTRPDVAAIDHDRIITAATRYLTQPATPLTTLPAKRSPGTPHDFYSEAEDYWPDATSPDAPYTQRSGPPNPEAFTTHRDALLNLSLYVPALTAAFVLTKDDKYAKQAITHLHAWFIDPATGMTPNLQYAQVIPPANTGRPEGLLEAVHLAEVAQSIPFLANSESLSETDLAGVQKWFADYFDWLNYLPPRRPRPRPEEPPRQLLAPPGSRMR